MEINILPKTLHFKLPAGTSRGVYTERKVWYVIITSPENPEKFGIGECAPLVDLSCDWLPDYEYILTRACLQLEKTCILDKESLRPYPSILFGLETALQHFNSGSFALWDTAFSQGKAGIPINGLIWMGSKDFMFEQIKAKLESGFRCLKLKIGAIDFEEELELLRYVRSHFSPQEVELRVDANGAFRAKNALEKLKRLSGFELHSIEQPIRAGQWEEMAELCKKTPLPIALDEELIGNFTLEDKKQLLKTIRPQYIILKPSLHGSFSGCREWISEAEKLSINWWVTSALESNIGLNAIAQWTATLNNPLPQGLGTGQLFTDNIPMPVEIKKDCLWIDDTPYNSPKGVELRRLCNTHTLSELDGVFSFLKEWFNDKPVLIVHTSGSTGVPKNISVRKSQMEASARMTCNFLGLKKGDRALLCMPVKYIAGKMMIVRSIVAGLDLISEEPSGNPLAKDLGKIDFCAMTPMQVYNSLQVTEEKERLKQISVLLIGGGAIDKDLEKALSDFPNTVYSSYGMTETLSHIALRRLNGKEKSDYYTVLPGVRISLSEDDTLMIDAPLLCDELLKTNDIARIMPDGGFAITGRKDNVINSGGIKMQIEEIEDKLRNIVPAAFAVTSAQHPKFGEAMVLLVENDDFDKEKIKSVLNAACRPKQIVKVEKIPLTGSGKIDRKACKDLV
jgi:o-succinylbenzoate synthase